METLARVAFVNSQVLCAEAELSGLKAQNTLDSYNGDPPTYLLLDFEAVIENYELGHNQVISYLREY